MYHIIHHIIIIIIICYITEFHCIIYLQLLWWQESAGNWSWNNYLLLKQNTSQLSTLSHTHSLKTKVIKAILHEDPVKMEDLEREEDTNLSPVPAVLGPSSSSLDRLVLVKSTAHLRILHTRIQYVNILVCWTVFSQPCDPSDGARSCQEGKIIKGQKALCCINCPRQ